MVSEIYKQLPTRCKIHTTRKSFKFNTITMNRIRSSYIEYYCDDDCDEWLGWFYKSENGVDYGIDKCSNPYVLDIIKNYKEQTIEYNHSQTIAAIAAIAAIAGTFGFVFFVIMICVLIESILIWIMLIVLLTTSFAAMLHFILSKIWKAK